MIRWHRPGSWLCRSHRWRKLRITVADIVIDIKANPTQSLFAASKALEEALANGGRGREG